MKKLWITLMTVVSVLGFMPAADAASGYVNMEAVLASTPAFVQAGKTLAAEQQKMQQQFNEESKKLSDKEKQALGEKLNRQLAEKEKQLMTPIQEKLKMAIAKAAKEKSVDIVINAREVVYGGIDLTESVKKNMK
ncbi:MAG: OmpH family outer membrane protein [Succiniclasticum sp.]|nr:OmpH family outer membrane protein [Succiniclasticum sp.]